MEAISVLGSNDAPFEASGAPTRPADSPAGSRADASAQRQAVLRAFTLRWELDDGVPGASEAVDALLETADCNDWADVRRAALYVAIHRATIAKDGTVDEAIRHLLDQAQADGNAAMIALALAFRVTAWLGTGDRDRSMTTAADADLARATALLEHGDGSALERITAHNRCAIAYGQRHLFELEHEQYSAVEDLLDQCEDVRRVAGLRFNQAEANLSWACALRHRGTGDAVKDRVAEGMQSLAACESVEMPADWRWELAVVATLLAAVGGEDVADQARRLLSDTTVSPTYEGHLHLALALSTADKDLVTAAEAAERAVELIDPVNAPPEHDLALRVAAELEEKRVGGSTAGFRYGSQQTELRWNARLSTLAAMEELLHSERLRTETEFLRQQAFLDDLTGLSNRRGYARYIAGLGARGSDQVAMLLVDVDRFKQVNDRFGHAVGDATLVRLARVLSVAIRVEDLAARLGGDEFVVLLAGAGTGVGAARARAILDAIAQEPWEELHNDLVVRASIGVVADHPSRCDEMAVRADTELYRAKAAGGARASVNR
ncbi:MAG TPA: GGDEF domain-containing protein [Acidimicrobiales bacterium]|jgi:diguanylate cyclase (GGDEF)-like protein|nr:GGDEF domain-containing protein [Acidimicrobiales bacterium]